MDFLTSEARSERMSRIRSKDTKPEMVVRSYLHVRGLRYKVHVKELPGKPDIVFPSRKIAIFVHGCFWHGHSSCHKATIPKTQENFWRAKIEGNAKRDRRATKKLRTLGWRVFIVWECRICESRLAQLYQRIAETANSTPCPPKNAVSYR